MASLDSTVVPAKLPAAGKSFAQALSDSSDPQLTQLPPKIVMGKSVRVKITQTEYEAGLTDCSSNLHGRLMLHKGDAPLTTLALKTKLNNLWPHIHNWDITPLGRGFFEFHFSSVEEMHRIWAMGAVNLKPGLLRFYCWTSEFSIQAQTQTHAQIWVRLMPLPQEYWRKKTLFEIASGLGTPLIIDKATLNRRFGLYARVLVDVDLSEQFFEAVIVEREGHALSVTVQYEKQPSFCTHCKMLGHDIHSCLKSSSLHQKEGFNSTHNQAQTAPQHNRKPHTANLNGKHSELSQNIIQHNRDLSNLNGKRSDLSQDIHHHNGNQAKLTGKQPVLASDTSKNTRPVIKPVMSQGVFSKHKEVCISANVNGPAGC